MHTVTLSSNWDTLLLGLPMIVLLFFGFFRLDEVFSSPRKSGRLGRKLAPTVRGSESSMRTDPDGRPWDN